MKEITITIEEYESLISDRARCDEMRNHIIFYQDLLRQVTHDALYNSVCVDKGRLSDEC